MPYILIADQPPTGKPGDQPQPSTAEREAFFSMLGHTIGQWQLVEAILYIIYQHLVQPQNNKALSASFHRIPNIRGRLDMVDTAVKNSEVDTKLLEDWGKIETKFRKRAGRRNEIAHFVTLFDPTRAAEHGRLFLGPSPLDTGYRASHLG